LAALNPDLYRNLFLRLLPEAGRARATELLDEIAYTLQWWFIGQLVPMGVLGLATFFGLWIVHVPLAYILALFTALMLFIPYGGSVVAFVPSVLVALMRGPVTVLYVVVLLSGGAHS
jgi:predicted PurR-regulated permease PerM